MSNNPAAPLGFPGLTEVQDFWQSALKRGVGATVGTADPVAELQVASARWMSHRQEDFGKAVETLAQIASCKSPAEAMALQQKWFAESLQSLMSDWMALVTPGTFGSPGEPSAPTERPIPVKKAPGKTAS